MKHGRSIVVSICASILLAAGFMAANSQAMGKVKTRRNASRELIYSDEKLIESTPKEILQGMKGKYENVYKPEWESIKKYPIPEWFKKGKFGIYVHWGPYCVPAWKTEWYPHGMYMKETFRNTDFYGHHLENFGHPSKFGYKDFIPDFTAENFDADEWAELFEKSGATFAGPCCEHHDGFAMWDSALTKWDCKDMGPMRDITGELELAVKKRDMKFVVSFHHARNWFYYTREDNYDTTDPRFSYVGSIYGPLHGAGNPNAEYLEDWEARVVEVIDKYDPDLLWFDGAFGKDYYEPYKLDMTAYYYNKAVAEGDEVGITHKRDMPEGAGIIDNERGSMPDIQDVPWLTDNSVFANSWGFIRNISYYDEDWLIDEIVDVVSKNGSMLLNVGPDRHGNIPKRARNILLAIGDWLEINGEAIYGTQAWKIYGEGPTKVEGGSHNRRKEDFVSSDVRFTSKDDTLYVITLAKPESGTLAIKSLGKKSGLLPGKIAAVGMVGSKKDIAWNRDANKLTIEFPEKDPCKHAFVFKVKTDE